MDDVVVVGNRAGSLRGQVAAEVRGVGPVGQVDRVVLLEVSGIRPGTVGSPSYANASRDHRVARRIHHEPAVADVLGVKVAGSFALDAGGVGRRGDYRERQDDSESHGEL